MHTHDGLRPIEDIRPGTLVLSRNPATGEQGYKPVVETFVTHPDSLRRLRYTLTSESGEQESGVITGTGEHPFHAPDADEFVSLAELTVGRPLSPSDRAATAYVTDIEVERGPPRGAGRFTTYNFEVADWSTYFVSPPEHAGVERPVGLWVHNTGRAVCERIASMYHRIRDRDGLSPFDSFTVFMEKTSTPARRATVDSHLRYAVREMSLEMMSDPAHVLSHVQMKNAIANNPAMQGRVGLATKLEVHHSVPIYVQKHLDLPPGVRDSCPGMLLHVDDHQISNLSRPNSFHTILNKYIPQHQGRFNDMFPNGLSREQAKTELANAYRDWIIQNGLEEPGIDHLANISSRINTWMDSVP